MLEHPDITAALATGRPRPRPGWRYECHLCGAHIYEDELCYIIGSHAFCPCCIEEAKTYA